VAVAIVLVYLGVATFPGTFDAVLPGLDPGWVWGINRIPSTAFRFGEDVIFTYGPLGYLITPLPLGDNLIGAAVLWVLSQAAMLAVAVYHYRRTRSVLAVGAFAAGILLAQSFNLLFEYRLLVLLGALLTVSPEDRRPWLVASGCAAALAAVLTYTKLSTGLAAVALLGVAMIGWVVRRRVRLRDAAGVAVGWVLATVLVGLWVLDGSSNLARWIGLSLDLSGGYVRAMSVQGPTLLLVLGLLAVGVFAVYVAATALWDRPGLAIALPFAGAVFVAFRHAFVRHQGRFLYPLLLGVFAVAMLTAASRRRLLIAAAATALVIPVAGLAAAEPFCSCPWRPDLLGPTAGAEHLVSTLRLGATEARLRAAGRDNLAVSRLPARWRELMAGATADAVPFDLSFIAANDLRWTPNPVLQLYHAFTPELDRRTARHFFGPDGPRFLVLQYADVDERNPMLAEPRTWRAIAARYEEVGRARAGDGQPVALLERRAEPVPLRQRTLSGSAVGSVGRWVDIPASKDLVLASVELEPDPGGRLAVLFWRYAPVYADLRYADGTVRTVRILPATAGEGMVVNRPPFDLPSFLRLVDGDLPPAAVAFRLRGPGAGSFEPSFAIRWTRLPWHPAA
jgi:hypothetical protein